MARPMNPLPDTTSGDRQLVDFAAGLRSLRTKAGSPNLAAMSERSGICMSSLSGAQGGHKMPTWRTVEGYVRACGADATIWHVRWQKLQLAQRTTRARSNHAAIMKNWASLRRISPPRWPMDETELAEILDQLRRFRGLSLRNMADRSVGYSHHTYGNVLRGDRPVTAGILLAILHACAVSPDEMRHWLYVLARVRPSQALRVQSLLTKIPTPRVPVRYRAGTPAPMGGGARMGGGTGSGNGNGK
ncbi:helix-turn-helix domain-containing protein [Streptomyces sp. NPDC091387]|uniref:helix-turn-helix domain-containing protein n=1 Tax=Streptomyces sp. NPDC091387 TaxID=3365998 RepID=UPI0037F90965